MDDAEQRKSRQPYSSSVEVAIRRFSQADVTAAKLASDILVSHAHYGSNRGREFGTALIVDSGASHDAENKPASEWVEEVSALYKPNVRINGRYVVVGLALLDSTVRAKLRMAGFLAELSREKGDGPSAAESLDTKSKAALEDMLAGALASGSVETFSDSPAAADQLGRRAFADVLAARIRRVRANETHAPIVIHLDGPWGSGKSTVLNFLADSLTASASPHDKSWVILRYNAWQQQRTDPPWWTLTARLVSAASADLVRSGRYAAALKLRLRNYYFKTFSGRTWVFVAGLFALCVGVVLFRFSIPADSSTDATLKSVAAAAKDLLSVVAAVFGIVLAASRFATASDTTAQEFIKSRPDPLGALTDHLAKIFSSLERNVAILVDDIDRCNASTVVTTLDGIHTIFTTLPIVFVVAGDGRWIERAFEKAYGDFAPSRPPGGQTLGGLFLEKIFQISASIPHMPEWIKNAFWKQLLRTGASAPTDANPTELSEIAQLSDEENILAAVQAVDARQDPEKALRLREAAMRRLSAPDLIENPTGHVLEVFRDSVESNPRAMKRHIMAYGMARATDLASFRNTPQSVLATLSVLTLRWPVLARWLAENPRRLLLASSSGANEFDAEREDRVLVDLMRSGPVVRLLRHADRDDLERAIASDADAPISGVRP